MAEKAFDLGPFAITVKDLDGKSHTWEGIRVTRKNQKEIYEKELAIGKEAAASTDGAADRMYKFAALYFGHDLEYYDNFDYRIVAGAVKKFTEDLQNPTI